jgi:3-dehydroquinate dehydratase-2
VSVTAAQCNGQIVGLGLHGYLLAIDAIINMIEKNKKESQVD